MRGRAALLGAVFLGLTSAGGVVRAQDDGASVAPLVVTAPPEVPPPQVGEGAPLFSPAEIAAVGVTARQEASSAASNARRCAPTSVTSDVGEARTIRELLAAAYRAEQQAGRALTNAAEQAQAASLAARNDRQAAAVGDRTPEQLAASELARQGAVNHYVIARTAAADARALTANAQRLIREAASMYVDPYPAEPTIVSQVRAQLLMGPRSASTASLLATPPEYIDLTLEDIVARQREDRSGAFLVVSGKIRNGRATAVATPSLSVSAVDVGGFPLKTETADGRGRIKPGAVMAFQYELRPKPSQTRSVVVGFASRSKAPMTLPPGFPLIPPPPGGGASLDCSG